MDFEDKVIVCGDCGKEFTHTAEDQARYAERGFSEDPKRCRECRQARKDKAGQRPRPERREGGGPRPERRGPPRSRDRGFPSGGGGGYGGGRGGGGGGYSRGPRQSYDAVCAACGAQTTVPFEPSPGRQVYCRQCFQQLKGDR